MSIYCHIFVVIFYYWIYHYEALYLIATDHLMHFIVMEEIIEVHCIVCGRVEINNLRHIEV